MRIDSSVSHREAEVFQGFPSSGQETASTELKAKNKVVYGTSGNAEIRIKRAWKEPTGK